MTRALLFDTFAALVSYPGVEYRVHHARALALLRTLEAHPFDDSAVHIDRAQVQTAVDALGVFATETADCGTAGYEELYTRTFDINPACALELGWHLHGESYDRGAFLVRMRALLAQHNLAESAELPDHLSHALALFGRMSDDEAAAFARESLKPALAQMRTPLAAAQNPHDHLLAAVEAVLQAWCTQPIGVPTP